MRNIFRGINVVLTLLLIIAAAGVAFVVLPFFGNQALIVRSGSMQPTIDIGSIVVVRPNTENLISPKSIPLYNVGDIIAFRSEKNPKTLITHRVTGIETRENGIFYKTQGDANEDPDNWSVSQKNILGKSFFVLPAVGRLLTFAKSGFGLPSLIILPAILVILMEAVSIIRELRRRKKPQPIALASQGEALQDESIFDAPPAKPGLNLFGFKKVLIPLLIFSLAAPVALALSNDTETSPGNIFQASNVFPTPTPIPQSCPTTTGTSVVINEINWVGSNGDGLDEWVELCNTTSSPINLTNWVVERLGTGSGINAHVTIPSGIIPANGFFLISNRNQANSKINVAPDLVDSNVSLDNGGEQLILKNNIGTTIDTANGTGAWFAGSNSTPKKSMERKSPVGAGTVLTNWQTATTHTNMDASGPTDEFATPKAANGL